MSRRLSRRTLLKAAGVSLALPLLDAMSSAPLIRAAGTAASGPPRRFVGMMTNQGIMPEFFFPAIAAEGSGPAPPDAPLPAYLELLKDHRNDLTSFSGVSLPGVDGGHAAEKSFLTGAPGASRGSFKNSVSLDQVMAEQIGSETRFPSLSLMVGSDSLSLSWTRSGSMIPPVSSPVKLFGQLFVDETPEGRAAAVRRLKEDRSLLDDLRDQSRRLEQSVGAADRERLDQYFSAVRDLERRLAKAEGWLDVPKPKVDVPAPAEITDSNDLPKNCQTMLDLVRLALETDSTRIVTVCISLASVTARTIPGVSTSTHELTHHGGREEKVAELRRIEEAEFRAVGNFLTGLRGVKEEGGALFDRTSVLFGTNMGSANSHANDNLPVLLAGGGFKHVGHLAFDRQKNYPLSNLYVSLLQRMGMETSTFSSGTGTMRGLEMT